MKTKTKVLLSVGAVCLVAVVAVVAIVAVFAASTQSVTSSINVTYKAQQVSGTASAKWYSGADKSGDMDTNGPTENGSTELTFTAGQSNANGTLSPQVASIDLDETHLYVIFEYKFTNTGEQDYKASLNFSGTRENVEVRVFDSETQYTKLTSWTKEDATGITQTVKENGTNAYFSDETVAAQDQEATVHYFYVVVSVDPDASGTDASFSGSFAWTLSAVKAA